jgi:aminoglycoside phosphotransferase
VTLRELMVGCGLRSVVMGASKDPNAKITILLVEPRSGEPRLAAKVPTTDVAAQAIAAERAVLEALDGLDEAIPRVLGEVDFEGRRGLVTTAVRGTPMTTSYLRRGHVAGRDRVDADFAAVGGWLATFQDRTAGAPAAVDIGAAVEDRLRRRFAADDRIGDDLERLAAIHDRLAAGAPPHTAVHGDMWCGNVVLDAGRVAGVVDWECGAATGEPVRDLARFAHMYALFLDRRTRRGRRVRGHSGLRAGEFGAGVEHALDGAGWFPELFRRFLQDGLARLGGSPERWRDAALAGIAEVAAMTDEDGFARLHLALFRRTAQPRGGLL